MGDHFEEALKHTLQFEGVYANDPADGGGETFRGISRRNWPKWNGWPLIDGAKSAGARKAKDINECFFDEPIMQRSVADFYYQNFWKPLEPLEAPDRIMAKLFDTAVNLGQKGAIIVLQRALNRTDPIAPLAEDGIIGPRTKEALNLALTRGERWVLSLFVEKQADYYQRIVARRPSQKKFLNGWLRRAAWIPEDK